MGDLPEGGAAAELRPMASHSTPFAEPNPSEIGTINWATAERTACEIIRKVQPNSVSDERRKKVVDYIQRLIRNCLGAEVFPYGSVPLKTYLPDGDIDLTTFGGANVEDTLADDMKTILEEEERKVSAEFSVKDVQLVRAEVKLVKCIVQDIVVDVSFNQIGGLCTLCFLEQVDRLIGKNHLFKRSIILIKAWCYYESRILGAHHGLISTYALETMVLYIFHLFHSTLDGPLAVLFKFLDYFSKFDWETYCISLNGPVWVSSLPAILVEMPEDRDKDLLLSSDFLSSCISMFSVPSRGGDKNSRGFQPKHLNIFDPLKEINNLGRSVSKGNFYRIRSAFSYGARKLARILLQPADSIDNELHKFFPNTVARHGGGQRPDVQVIDKDDEAVASSTGSARSSETAESSNSSDLSGDYESYLRCLHYGRWCYESGLGLRSLPLAPMYQSNSPWDGGVLPLPHYKQNGGLSYRHHNGPHPGPAVFALAPVLLPGVTFGWEEMPKPRGTGTYFPNTNQLPQGYRSSTVVKGKNQAPSKSSVRNNGRNATFTEASVPERSGHEVPQPSPRRDGHPNANALFIQHEGGVDFASVERGPGTSASEQSRRQKPVSSSPRTLSGVQRSPSSLSKEQDRILLGSSYRLKDEDDFPPLPV